MGKKDELEQEPLLYITQPHLEKARVSMQQSFIIKTDKPKTVQKKTESESSILLEQETPEASEEQNDVKEEYEIQSAGMENIEELVKEEEKEKEKAQTENENTIRKSFKDLDNKQKIYYLLNRPHYIPEVLCEFKTHSGIYIGYLKSFENQTVTIRAYNQLSIIKFSYSDIINIQMRML